MVKALVTGAAGFLGGHLVAALKARGRWVRAVDCRVPTEAVDADERWWNCDLRDEKSADHAVEGVREVYTLAASGGGAGWAPAEDQNWRVLSDNARIDMNVALACARWAGVSRVLYASSGCIYNRERVREAKGRPLREAEAFPAWPDSADGWSKLYGELWFETLAQAHAVEVRVARLHDVYGPGAPWAGAWDPCARDWRPGREGVVMALCRKAARAVALGERDLEVWGDGQQARAFLHVDDAVRGMLAVAESDERLPVNLGWMRPVTVNELAGMVIDTAGGGLRIVHGPGPEGARGRVPDLGRASMLGWKLAVPLVDGIEETYAWVNERVREALR